MLKSTKISRHLLPLALGIGIPSLTFLLGFFAASSRFHSKPLPVSQNLIPLNSTEGEKLLSSSKALQDYLPLSAHFVAQKNPAYCGVASMVMVLNALAIPAPVSPELGNSHAFTQDNVFNEQMQQVRSPAEISKRGMTLETLGQLLSTYPVKVEVHYASDMTLDEFRNLTAKNLQQPNNVVTVNYLRQSIGQQKWGHISPIAAYNDRTDRFLILDVSRNKYPPVWVKAQQLWEAMATIDSESGKTRGLVLVSR
jgi:Phytochelatin synthase